RPIPTRASLDRLHARDAHARGGRWRQRHALLRMPVDGRRQQCHRRPLLLRHEARAGARALARQGHPSRQDREALTPQGGFLITKACPAAAGARGRAKSPVVRSALFCPLVLLCALGASLPARADLAAAMTDFKEGRYEAAHEEFQALAGLGDPASQFNLGAMALQGQGGPKDPGTAVGWLMAALDNGYKGLARDKVDEMKPKLTDEQ